MDTCTPKKKDVEGEKGPCVSRESNPGLVRGRDVFYH